MHYLFTYGTLQNSKMQLALFKRLLKGQPDQLKGFKQESIILGNNRYPILIKSNDPKNTITGICYALNEKEIKICDEYEGSSYQKIKVTLESKKEAWVYIEA